MFYVKSDLEVAEELLLKATTCHALKQFAVAFK